MIEFTEEQQQWIYSHYLLLPVDADGAPIYVGDRLTNINKPSDEYTVAGVSGERLFVYGGHAHICASQCRHVNPRTIEDVLRDLANEVWEASITCQNTWSDSGLDGIEKRYAAEIRELMEVDE